jgi:small subunit ribosomal protein S2
MQENNLTPVRTAQDTSGNVSMKSLLEAGSHFGHQTHRWNPRMSTYIYSQRNGIHIIDLQQTLSLLIKACAFIESVIAKGQKVLFVGTKTQAQDSIKEEAAKCSMPYINQRWLGGTLTNFETIQARINHLLDLEDRQAKGEFARYQKKEALKLEQKINKLNRSLGGIKTLKSLPGAIFIVDVGKDKLAVLEAKRLGVPTVALVDTDCDPTLIDYPIPGNDDAIRSIRLVSTKIAEACNRGSLLLAATEAEAIAAEAIAAEAIAAAATTTEPDAAIPTSVSSEDDIARTEIKSSTESEGVPHNENSVAENTTMEASNSKPSSNELDQITPKT